MTFKAPDYEKYPCIPLAYAAGRAGGSMTAALNAANERANELFRGEKLGYLGEFTRHMCMSIYNLL